MSKLWSIVNKIKLEQIYKNAIYLTALIIINVAIGAVAWLLVGRHFLSEIYWLACFMGYPAVFVGFFGGSIYLYNHEFE